MPDVIRDKRTMYRLLASGAFGNTSPMWTDVIDWCCTSPDFPLWGIRSMVPGGPSRLDVPTDEVSAEIRRVQAAGYDYQISAMVDSFRTGVFNVWDSPTGMVVEGKEWPDATEKWRPIFAGPHGRWTGVAAWCVLARHLNENSADDLRSLFERWPGHVVELTTLSRCFGTVPHRNAVVWEVRGGGENGGY